MTDFVAGWMGGISVLLVGHPFDTIKVWQQSSITLNAALLKAPQHNSIFEAVTTMYHVEGVGALYKGICAPMCAVGLANAALFGCYSAIVNFFIRSDSFSLYSPSYHENFALNGDESRWQDDHRGNAWRRQDLSEQFRTGGGLTAFENFIASTGGGMAHATIMNPFEVIKIRRQTEHLFPHRRYLGTVHCARRLYANGGIKAFFKGYDATLIRDIPGTGMYLCSYSTLIQAIGGENNYSVSRILLAGGCAGVAQWIVIFPLDTIKTRLQVAKESELSGWTRCARQLYNRNGFRGLYRGVAPALVRAFAANGAAFVGVEATLKFFRTNGMENAVASKY